VPVTAADVSAFCWAAIASAIVLATWESCRILLRRWRTRRCVRLATDSAATLAKLVRRSNRSHETPMVPSSDEVEQRRKP
jgi:hypothetical protein